jgi:hypothetical protein
LIEILPLFDLGAHGDVVVEHSAAFR